MIIQQVNGYGNIKIDPEGARVVEISDGALIIPECTFSFGELQLKLPEYRYDPKPDINYLTVCRNRRNGRLALLALSVPDNALEMGYDVLFTLAKRSEGQWICMEIVDSKPLGMR